MPTDGMILLGALVLGLIIGLIVASFFGRQRAQVAAAQARAQVQPQIAVFEEQLTRVPKLETELAQAKVENNRLTDQLSELSQQLGAAHSTIVARDEKIESDAKSIFVLTQVKEGLESRLQELRASEASLSTQLKAEQQQGAEKLALLEQAKEHLSLQFKELANQILEDKSKRFTDQNQKNIKHLLDPIQHQLREFKDQVEKTYYQENKDRSALASQVKQLMELNTQLSDDAKNLTSALKGQSKIRGDWGELILERILESSGLRKDQEYTVQKSHTREDGSRAQPDVIINLPEDKYLVVDSKVSLNAYLEYAEAEDEAQRTAASKRHMASIKGHIKDLSSKNYQALYGVKSLDCVIMFIPVESAFMLAISCDAALWQEAWNKNVLLVSPTTLLFVIRTVAHLWRQEQQNQNAQDIAKRGGLLYDKFVNFVEDLEDVGKRIRMTQESYNKACTKFYDGTGNLIRQAEMLRDMGISPKKSLPANIVEKSLEASHEFSAGKDKVTG